MEIAEFGKDNIKFIEVKNSNNFCVTFTDLGAAIYSIQYFIDYLTLTPISIEDYKNPSLYHGKTIGRVANRIKGGKININNTTYRLNKNEGNNTLHGGKDGLSNLFFTYQINKKGEDEVEIIFHHLSYDGEGGFPGNVDIYVSYTINEKNEIYLKYHAISDQDTLLALTNHSYFLLGEKSNKNLRLTIKANKYIYPDPKNLLPISINTIDKIMDFRKPKCIGKDIDHPTLINSRTYGYDHHYCFTNINPNEVQVSLESKIYKMEIYTSFDGVQIYTDNYPDTLKWYATDLVRRRGIAIEPQSSILDRKILKANVPYEHFIKYCFTKI